MLPALRLACLPPPLARPNTETIRASPAIRIAPRFAPPWLALPCFGLAVQRVAMVKPEKARQVEEFLLRQRKPGGDKVPEGAIIRLLESIAEQEAKAAKVTVVRKMAIDDEDDGFDEDDF